MLITPKSVNKTFSVFKPSTHFSSTMLSYHFKSTLFFHILSCQYMSFSSMWNTYTILMNGNWISLIWSKRETENIISKNYDSLIIFLYRIYKMAAIISVIVFSDVRYINCGQVLFLSFLMIKHFKSEVRHVRMEMMND